MTTTYLGGHGLDSSAARSRFFVDRECCVADLVLNVSTNELSKSTWLFAGTRASLYLFYQVQLTRTHTHCTMASLLVRRFSSAPAPKCALVVGSMGQLGQEVMAHFGTAGWNTLGFDASAGEGTAHVQLPAGVSSADLRRASPGSDPPQT